MCQKIGWNLRFWHEKRKISYVFIKNFRKKKIISQIICIFAPRSYEKSVIL